VQALIEFDDVSKSFGPVVAVSHLSLVIKKGEIFGIAGPNGAGKTTIVRMLCTALKPDSGSIRVDGMDVFENESAVKRQIGYLPEEPNLYERMTARRLLSFFGELYGMNDREKRIEEVLELVGLLDRAERRISTFSKGMRHRLSLARALLHNPRILVLDEPTMGLDPGVATSIRELIRSMKGEKTVVLCTHYMDEAEMLCDRLAILSNGRAVAVDTPSQLKRKASEELGREAGLNDAFLLYTS